MNDTRYDLPEILYDDDDPGTLRQLRALCHRCMGGHQPVGEPFRFNTDQIHITDTIQVSYARWFSMTVRGQRVNLYCPHCDKVTIQTPKGAVEVDE
jgi:hypothetical protein